MRKTSYIFNSFRTKVTMLFIVTVLFSAALSNIMIYRYTIKSQFNQLRDKMIMIAQTAASMIEAETLLKIPLNADGINTPQYKSIVEKLNGIKKSMPLIKYIYIMGKTEQQGIWQFIADPDPVLRKGGRAITSFPGDSYNAGRFPEMLKAFNGPSADKALAADEWGVTLSGYAPIRNASGKSVAILGVDMIADEVYKVEKEVNRRFLLMLISGVIVSIVIGIFISRGVTRPIEKLVNGMRQIETDNLKHHIEVKGHDEIGQLTKSFNRMSESLFQSRKKLHNYFYNVLSSLVRVLEARDQYTKGHSDRVAEYATKIAHSMGLEKDKIELIRETALIHDIGKLAIQDSILNKKEKLSDEEWYAIRKHPLIAEDMLKPISLNKEILAVVRGHHEHYDGTGYPDRLSGEHIDLFSQIISVVDAFDAMTSSRAYRPALSKETAIEELRKNRGTQFNPYIVDIFIKILQET